MKASIAIRSVIQMQKNHKPIVENTKTYIDI